MPTLESEEWSGSGLGFLAGACLTEGGVDPLRALLELTDSVDDFGFCGVPLAVDLRLTVDATIPSVGSRSALLAVVVMRNVCESCILNLFLPLSRRTSCDSLLSRFLSCLSVPEDCSAGILFALSLEPFSFALSMMEIETPLANVDRGEGSQKQPRRVYVFSRAVEEGELLYR